MARGTYQSLIWPVDNIYLPCYTAICLSSIAGAGYSSPFPSHQRVHTRWFGRALEWHSRGRGFDPLRLHQKNKLTLDTIGRNADGIGLFRGCFTSNFTGKTKDPNGGPQKLAGFKPPNSLEIYSALFEMGFFKKGAIFISRKRALKLQILAIKSQP